MRGMVIIAALLVTGIGISGPANADDGEDPESNVVECRDALELLYGRPFDSCTPYSDETCVGYGSVPVLCASATASPQYIGVMPVAGDCPDDVGQPPPLGSTSVRCLELEAAGWGFGLTPGHATTGSHEIGFKTCNFGAAGSCSNTQDLPTVYWRTTAAMYCLHVVTETAMIGMAWIGDDTKCV